MEQVLTVACKLQVDTEQVDKLNATLLAFSDACNYINQTIDPKLTNNVRIQSLIYEQIRDQFGLSANLAIRAINRVAGNRKTAKKAGKPVKAFKPTSADYDARIFSFREKDWTVSLNLVGGRERFKLSIGNYQRHLLNGKIPTSATLCKHQDGNFYINIQVKSMPPDPQPTDKVIGVDLGRRDIAVTSDGATFSGEEVTAVRDRFAKLRQTLQKKASKGTRSSRRRIRKLLQRLSGRERRFQQWVNHNVSKKIVCKALSVNATISVEDLTGIRERTNQQPRNKTERRRSNSWAFWQLRTFLEYKSIRAGIELVKVNPAYTSQTCHVCLHIHPVQGKSYRSGKHFRCEHCSWHGDADLNGALNIASLGTVLVNQPGGSGLSCSLNKHLRATESPRSIA
ncbi:RNA-guided endonuclease InsQ/TnpB family protein [Pseudanabaena sp. PCC 6802]|uniref:RNA-guided endonuclease InsQ/TnpB family protein n=1 Tax=Pseudanabaena sp. PCC 6802 TaxID=118173 RepID=UPI000364812C|nr:RNA-guided endonuclease TnpB family protein [Pseudanabaena sp. PCC 6802]